MARTAALNLEALADAYLGRVRAELLLQEQAARDEAAATASAARGEVERRRADAAAEASSAGDASVRRIRADGTRAVRNQALAAQRSVYEEAYERSLTAVLELRHDGRYEALLNRLSADAHRRLGSGAAITRDPGPDGGVVASCEGRVLDLTLPSLARRSLEELGPQIEALWH